jgi:hypothetical protein
VGRWGSNEPRLGIPVEWDEISGARVIVGAGFRDFRVTPSQGSHFFSKPQRIPGRIFHGQFRSRREFRGLEVVVGAMGDPAKG